MQLKDGVSLAGIQPEIVLALVIARNVFTDYLQDLVVTSVLDGEHMKGSLHYVGAAVDIRCPNNQTNTVVQRLRDRLGNNYDVVRETDHIHIEFQPKHGAK